MVNAGKKDKEFIILTISLYSTKIGLSLAVRYPLPIVQLLLPNA